MNLIIFLLPHIFLVINFIYLQSALLSDIRGKNYNRICSIGLTMSLLSELCACIAISIGSSVFLIIDIRIVGMSIAVSFIGFAVYDKQK